MSTPLALIIPPEVIEIHRKQLEKEEREVKNIVHLINTDALRALCTRYDNKEGSYPEHEYEGAAFFEYVDVLNTEAEKERGTARDQKKRNKDNLLLISNYDEWYGPRYTCPFCADEKLWNDFKCCPYCGGNLKGFRFEIMEEAKKRMKKENE